MSLRPAIPFLLLGVAARLAAATFGTVVSPAGGASYSDIVLDEQRSRLYLVNTAVNRIDVYNTRTRAFLPSIATDTQPVSAAISRDGQFLYVTAYTSATLDIIDLNLNLISGRVSLPTNPEGVAVGADGRVLITGIGTGAATTNTLLIYDPSPSAAYAISNVPVVPPAATPPVLPAPSGRIFLSYRSRLAATPDGRWIVGVNGPTATTKTVFLYETASGTVLRSRTVTNLSTALAIAPDGSGFMAGATLFDSQTLQVLAQENTANAPFTFTGAQGNAVFNLQTNQGGSVFTPDGSAIYAAFNIAPVGAARPTVTQLLVNDPDNLLINMGIELPENLAGRMVIEAGGANVYAVSDSGFTILPVSTINRSPIAVPQARSVLLTNDTCAALKGTTGSVGFDNAGTGRFTVSLSAAPTTVITGPGFPGPPVNTPAPVVTVVNTGAAPVANFRYNTAAATGPGTLGPSDFVITSPEAVNNPGTIHVYQNNRDSVSSGAILPIGINAVTTEGLTDIVLDTARQRLYIANSGLNRIEVFDLKQQKLLAPIKVGQLPHAMAFSSDGNTLYVANTGGESVSVVDLAKGIQTARASFPAFPFNAALAIANPVSIAVGIRGPQFIMSDGSWWKIDGNSAIPRALNPSLFGTARTIPGGTPAVWSMAATPAGEYVLVMNGSGMAWLYDSLADDFTLGKQALATITGYVGPLTAGPQGRYYAIGGAFLNSSLTAVAGGVTGLTSANRLVSAVTPATGNQVALFSLPMRTNPTAPAADAGMVELYDAVTGAQAGSTAALEGPATTITGAARAASFSRTMAVDTAGGSAYVLTASGLSVIKLGAGSANPALRPSINTNGIVNLADYTPGLATGGLMTIFGKNLGATQTAMPPFPTLMGGICVSLNNQPIPLELISAGQINAQIPTTLAAGRYPLVIRSIDSQTISASATVTVSKYAPAVLVGAGNQPAIIHASDGAFVDDDHPGVRDEDLLIFATGMGPTHGGAATTGAGAPSDPVALTDTVQVYFGNPLLKQSEMIVRSSSLIPSLAGIAQIRITIPGFHGRGSALPVTLRIGGVSSSTSGPAVPYVNID